MSHIIRLLAIDASTDACSVALYDNGNIIAENELAPKAHTRVLLPMIDRLLAKASLTLADLDAFAFGRGPGSFTGIRIACSMVQAFGYAFQKPIIPISTLQALAAGSYRTTHHKAIMAMIDARMGAVYWGLFQADNAGIMQPCSEEKRQSLDDIQLPEGHWERVEGYPLAEDIARLAVVEYQLGKGVLPEQIELTYLGGSF